MVQGEKQVQPVSRQNRAFRILNMFDLEEVPMAKAPEEDSNECAAGRKKLEAVSHVVHQSNPRSQSMLTTNRINAYNSRP
jgi:hypothetical protein